MRRKVKKVTVKILSLVLLFVMLGGVAVRVNALEPPTYDFRNWFRKGDTSVHVPAPAEDFLKLTCNDKEISPENYTVEADPDGMFYGKFYEDATIITLKEEYLQTLEDGRYCFESHFFAEENYSCDVTDASLKPYGIEYLGISSFYRVTRITYHDKNIDPAYYTATNSNGYQQILFNDEDYWKTLQPDFLKVYFAPNDLSEISYLYIITPESESDAEAPSDPPDSVNITPAASLENAPSVPSDENEANISPENSTASSDMTSSQASSHSQTDSSGESANMTTVVIVVIVTIGVAGGCVALGLILMKRHRNKKEDV